MTPGHIAYASFDGLHLLQFFGDVRFTICTPVTQLLQRVAHAPVKRPVLLDLRQTHTLDSTALGLLAQVAVYMRKELGQKPVVLLMHKELQAILRSVCFDRVLHIVQCEQGNLEQLSSLAALTEEEQTSMRQHVERYQHALSLHQKDQLKFRDIAHEFQHLE